MHATLMPPAENRGPFFVCPPATLRIACKQARSRTIIGSNLGAGCPRARSERSRRVSLLRF
jgi:hypothetical protein